MKEAVPAGDLLVQSWLGGRAGGGRTGVEEGLLFATAAGGDPAELVAAFDRLAAWVDRSLDLYKVGAGPPGAGLAAAARAGAVGRPSSKRPGAAPAVPTRRAAQSCAASRPPAAPPSSSLRSPSWRACCSPPLPTHT